MSPEKERRGILGGKKYVDRHWGLLEVEEIYDCMRTNRFLSVQLDSF